MKEKVLFSWSGGKDSALSLNEILRNQQYEVSALLTIVTQNYDRISMHGVKRILLEQQARALGFPLEKIFISKNSSNEEYESEMKEFLLRYQSKGVNAVVFGDVFLEEVRSYRENNLSTIGMRGIFPLWKKDSLAIAEQFIELGFKAIITCVDSKVLNKKFVGKVFNKQFLSELPSHVDPSGENGEFHSFVYDGPIFQKRLVFSIGDVVFRANRFYYCDLVPGKY